MRTWARSGPAAEEFRFSEALSALSFAPDPVEGQPEVHTVRSCLVGMRTADRFGLDEVRRSALFYALLLKDAGCSSNASKMSTLFDADDMEAKRKVKTVDWTSLPHAALHAARIVYHEATPQEKVLGILRKESATKMDPQCVPIIKDLATENRL